MKFNVIFTSPTYCISGVNTSATYLIRNFLDNGISSNFLLTCSMPIYSANLPVPPNIPIEILPTNPYDSWKSRCKILIQYLEERSPCIYLPGYDWEYFGISPKLSSRVGIIGVLHSDEQTFYDSVSSLGMYWNAIIAVSDTIAEMTLKINRTFADKLTIIPYGVPINNFPHRILDANSPLRIIYTGRIFQDQKRILDFIKIVDRLIEKQIPFKLTIIGDGPERHCIMKEWKPLIKQKIIRFLGTLSPEQIVEHLENHDVFILTSEYEGLPVSLLEAMAHGCIPVVTDIRSGIPELVKHGVNGFRVPIGDVEGFVDRLASLHKNLKLRHEMAFKNYNIIKQGGYDINNVAQRYMEVFQQVMDEIYSGAYHRPEGEMHPPRFLKLSPDQHQIMRVIFYQLKKIFPLIGHNKVWRFARGFAKNQLLISKLSKCLKLLEKIFRSVLNPTKENNVST